MSDKLNLSNQLDIRAIKQESFNELIAINNRVKYYRDELTKMSWKSPLTEEEVLIKKQAKEFAIALKDSNELDDDYHYEYIRQSTELSDLLKKEVDEAQKIKAICVWERCSIADEVKTKKPLPLKLAKAKNKRILLVGLVTSLADLNSDWDVNDKNIINEQNLQTIILKIAWVKESDTEEQVKNKLRIVFKNVTWEETSEFSQEDIKKFHEKLLISLNFLNSLWIWTWINAVLSWKMDSFINLINLKELKKREIDPETYEKLSPTTQNIVWALVTAWVLVLSKWFVMAWHEATNFESQSFIDRFQSEQDSPIISAWSNTWTWIKEALMWRKFSHEFWKDKKMTVTQIEEQAYEFTKEVMSLKLDWSDKKENITNPTLKSNYDYVSKILREKQNPEIKIALQKALIQSYILTLWKENQWEDYKFTLWLLFIWLHKDNIKVDYIPVKADKNSLKEDAKLWKRDLESSDFVKAWIEIKKLDTGNFNHIIPEAVQFDGDDRQFPVEAIQPKWVDLSNSKKIYDMHFTLNLDENKYIVTFTEKANQTEVIVGWDKQVISQEQGIRQWKAWSEFINVKNTNDKEVKLKFPIWDVLYSIWHNIDFSRLLKAISSWNKNETEAILVEMKKRKYKKLATYLLWNIDSFSVWDTYMSGNNNTRALKSPKYKSVRSDGVIKAEKALAKKMWFPEPGNEESFKIDWDYSSKQISESISGQEVTAVQFMTPVDRSSPKNINKSRATLHRVSVHDGSFAVSEKTAVVSDEARKRQIIEWILNSSDESRWIQNQLKKLNNFLHKNNITKSITLEEYKNFLVEWKISILWVERLKLQSWTETKFLEGRAMVAGNICLNLTYAIGYPAFELDGIKEDIKPAWSVDMEASLDLQVVSGEKSAIWGSILWSIKRFFDNKNGNIDVNGGGSSWGWGNNPWLPGWIWGVIP